LAQRILKCVSRHRLALTALLLSLVIHGTFAVPVLSDFFRPKPHLDKVEATQIEVVSLGTVASPTQAKREASAKKITGTHSSIVAIDKQLTAKKEIFGGGFFNRHVLNSASPDAVLSSEPTHGVTTAGDSREESEFSGDPMARVQASGQGWSGATQYGNAMGLGFTLESLRYFDALYDRVNSQLVYPDDFAKQRVTGRVRIEAELSKDGKLIRFLSSTADDRLLQTYCFAVLMQILSRPLPQELWLPYDRANVAFDFDFRIRIPKEAPHYFAREVQKNRLGFGRENEVDPWLNEKFNEIITHYIPPIIPIPGGFYIDLVAAYQFVNNLIEGTPTESEQRQARIEKLHEVLRGTVHRPSSSPLPSPTPES
jgi:hypothetical protein